jgi:hypothetical protein
MLVRNVKKGMILQLVDSGQSSVIQALENVRSTDRNGTQDSWLEFDAVDLVTGKKFQIGAANPAQPYAPGLTQVGWTCEFK